MFINLSIPQIIVKMSENKHTLEEELRIEIENEPKQFILNCLSGNDIVGYYIFVQDYSAGSRFREYSSTLYSMIQDIGIGRFLVESANEELSRRARKSKTYHIHSVNLTSSDSMQKLPHIFEEPGYMHIEENSRWTDSNTIKFRKIFRP